MGNVLAGFSEEYIRERIKDCTSYLVRAENDVTRWKQSLADWQEELARRSL